jgi:hypothetical protein
MTTFAHSLSPLLMKVAGGSFVECTHISSDALNFSEWFPCQNIIQVLNYRASQFRHLSQRPNLLSKWDIKLPNKVKPVAAEIQRFPLNISLQEGRKFKLHISSRFPYSFFCRECALICTSCVTSVRRKKLTNAIRTAALKLKMHLCHDNMRQGKLTCVTHRELICLL